MIDDRTSNLNLPKPNAANTLAEDVARLRSALDAIDAEIAARQAALGFTPENAANKGQPNGYASLDSAGKVPSTQLPTVIEDTDDVPEGAVNQYFTDARARAAQNIATGSVLGVVKVGSGLSVGGDGTLSAVGGGAGGLPAFNELVLTPSSNGQTAFAPSGGYQPGFVELYLNGVLLLGNGDDYTATDGANITLTFGVNTTDLLLLRRWTTSTNFPFSALTDKPTTAAGYGLTDVVTTAGNQTIAGIKTFSSSPVVPAGATGTQVPQAQEVRGLAQLTPSDITGTTGTVANGEHKKLVNVAATTVTAPASASVGHRWRVSVLNGRTNNVINWNGLKHEGLSDSTTTLDVPGCSVEWEYTGATYGWKRLSI